MKTKRGRTPKRKALLTDMELKFIAAWQGNGAAAAKAAGYKNPKQAAVKLLQKKRIAEAVFKKQAETVKASGQVLGKKLTKTDILDRALKLADLDVKLTKGTITGQVNALRLLAEIEGHIIKKTQALPDDFDRRTEEEKEFFATHGYWPNLDAGQSGSLGSQSPSPAAPKPN